MKRLYACVLIAAAVLALSICGGSLVQHFSAEMGNGLTSIEQAAARQDASGAAQAAQDCFTVFQTQARPLSLFVRQDYLTQFAETLRLVQRYAQVGQWEEALAECERARSQSENICRLFFRLL